MTSHDRFVACMHFKGMDRVPLWEWGPWPSTLRRWQREALGPDGRAAQFDECDSRETCGVDLAMRPRFQERVIAEDAETVTRMTDRGIITRTFKDPDAMSMPEHLVYPVRKRSDWESLRRRFDARDPHRWPADWTQRCQRWRRDRPMLYIQDTHAPSLFGFVRDLLGPERTLYAFYDDPKLVHDMMETYTTFLLDLLPAILRDAPVTSLFFWEDMCYRNGSLISPAMFREFMLPRYRRITDVLRRAGIDTVFVDSDGKVDELIPLWLQAGINGVYPMEVAAGMDVARLRRRYRRDLLMTGGIDKRVLAQDRAAIDRELQRTIPVADKGGYIPHLDHAIPHDVPYENFVYYWQRKKAMLGIP